jgi:hypothetical protein
MMKTTVHILSLLFALTLQSTFLCGQVKIQVEPEQISVNINGRPFTALHKGKAANKPFLYPLMTASGKRVTRGFPMEAIDGEATDHPHQRGMWLGFEHLSGMNIWENDPDDPHPHMGTIQFQNVVETHDGDKSGGFTIAAQWIDQDGQPIIDETLTLTFYAEPRQNRMYDVDLRLKDIKLATFEDSRDGLIGFRFATPFDEEHGGKVVNAEGVQGANQIEGSQSHWVDWQAELDGEKVGVAVMDFPANHHSPTSWRSMPFGLLFANPFAQRYYDKSREDGSMSLQPGDELRLRYRVLIHPANTSVAAAYNEYAYQ